MEKVSEDLLIIDKLVARAQIAKQKYEANGSSGKIQRQKLFSIVYPNESYKTDV